MVKNFLKGFLGLFVLINVISCAPKEPVFVDLKSFNENPEMYDDKRVILETDIKTLTEDPSSYIGKDVKISGFVKNIPDPFIYWGFYLEDETGLTIKCYEQNYVHSPSLQAEIAVKRAQRQGLEITIAGNLKQYGDIELELIEVKGEIIYTDFTPPSRIGPFRR